MLPARRFELLVLVLFCAALWVGCNSDELPLPSAGSGGAPAAGSGGAAIAGSGAGAAGTGTLPGVIPGTGGTSAAGSGVAGRLGAAGATVAAGEGGAGRGDAGRSGRAGRGGGRAGAGAAGADMPAAGGGAGTAAASGSGGAAGGCAQNLRCKLDALPSTGDPRQDCVDRINQFRTQCACLPELARWTEAEGCADDMSEYDSGAGMAAHAGFQAKVCTPGGSAQNECPGWPSESRVVSGCLQQMWDEGPPPNAMCSGDCFQTYGHFINMTNTRYKKVACGFFKNDAGKFWSVQNFSQ